MNTLDFVTEVLSMQEQANLDDFYPTDDVFKMVLRNANIVLRELQDEQAWSWLRSSIIIGDTNPLGPDDHTIPEYRLPDFVNRVSAMYQDCLRLQDYHKTPGEITHEDLINHGIIEVPYTSKGAIHHNALDAGNDINWLQGPYEQLKAVTMGKTLTFNRPLYGREIGRAVVVDVQLEIPKFHICNSKCKGVDATKDICYDEGDDYNPCAEAMKPVLDYMPAPDYVITKTAAYNSLGSPIAQDKKMEFEARAKVRLSKMREIDTAATDVDQIEFDPFEVYDI